MTWSTGPLSKPENQRSRRYGRLAGGGADGEDAFVIEAAHGFSSQFYGAVLAHFEREHAGRRRLEGLAVESFFALGRIKSLDLETAVYVEAEHGIHGHDKLETKLLLEHHKGHFDTRLNLIAEKALRSGDPIELGYAASADYELADDISVGAEAFGDLGTPRKFLINTAHYVGPSLKLDLDHVGRGELELRAGYLFAIGHSRDEANGQMRFGVEYEF